MFLDDELLNMCTDVDLPTPESVQQLNRDIYEKCEKYYKGKINILMSSKEIKATIDRTFNLFDSFIRQCKKSSNAKLNIIGKMFEQHSFKNQFLSHKEMEEIYTSL